MMTKFLIAFSLLLLTSCTSYAGDIHVAPDGNDANAGTAANPVATLKAAQSLDCAQMVYAHDQGQLAEATKLAASKVAPIESPARDAKSSDQKYWLNRSELRHLPLTPMQATKVNADLRNADDPTRWLSPRQKAMLNERREP